MTAAAPGRVVTEAEVEAAAAVLFEHSDYHMEHPQGTLLGPNDWRTDARLALEAAAALRTEPQPDDEVERLRGENDKWRQEASDRLNDLGRLLRALGLGDHARSISPAEVFDLCLRDIEGLRQRILDAEADAVRLHREKMEYWARAEQAERRAGAMQPEAIVRALCERLGSGVTPGGNVAHHLRAVLAEMGAEPAPAAAREIRAAALEEVIETIDHLRADAKAIQAVRLIHRDSEGAALMSHRISFADLILRMITALKQETDRGRG